MRSVDLSESTLAEQDAVLILTDHAAIDYEAVAAVADLVVDTRGTLRNHPEVVHS
jgi:UDP-N-acetyl-D-glucosamine dehydrogenase